MTNSAVSFARPTSRWSEPFSNRPLFTKCFFLRDSAMHKIAIPREAVDRVLRLRESLHVFGDINASRTALIVVDLQNGFMAPGQPAEIPVAREIIPNVNRISAALRSA